MSVENPSCQKLESQKSDIQNEYKVPRLLWESMESILLAQSRKYITELAKRLKVSEKGLIKKVLPTTDSIKIYIQDTQSEYNLCKAYTQINNITALCRKPTSYACEYCTFHRNTRMTIIKSKATVFVQKVKDIDELGVMWLKKNELVNSKGQKIGTVNKEKEHIKIFIIEST